MSDDRIRALVEQLRDFRARRAASDELIAAGSGAVRALLEALKREDMEGARWAILRCLGELRALQAVPAVAACLEQDDYRDVAHEALVKIAGRDLGPVPAEWLRWAERRAVETGETLVPEEGAEAAAPLSNARLVELALQGGCATHREEERGRYVVSLPVGSGATEQVTVFFGVTDHEGSEIVIVSADCGEARHDCYEMALRLNLRMPYGAIALRDVAGKPHFVMFNTILRQALTAIELRKSIFTVGERAFRAAKQLHR